MDENQERGEYPIECLEIHKKDIIYFIRNLTLKDYFSGSRSNRTITRRQYDLLNIVLESMNPFSLYDLSN